MTFKPCMVCGTPSDGPRCPDHPRPARPKPTQHQPRALGYDAAWDRLSKRARRLQPWCSDCHSIADLTTDHSPEAWARKADGKAIRLRDVDVVCRPCNARRGQARPTYAAGDMPQGDDPEPEGLGAPAVGKVRITLQDEAARYASGGMS